MNAQDYFRQKKKNHCQCHFHFPLCLLPFSPLWWEIATLVCRLVPLTHPEGVSRLEPNEGLGGHAGIRPRLFPNSHLVTSLGKVHLVLKIVRRTRAHTKKGAVLSDCCCDERIQRRAVSVLACALVSSEHQFELNRYLESVVKRRGSQRSVWNKTAWVWLLKSSGKGRFWKRHCKVHHSLLTLWLMKAWRKSPKHRIDLLVRFKTTAG